MRSLQKRRWFLLALLFVFMFVLASSALAVDNIQDLNKELNNQQTTNVKSTNLWLSFFQLIIVLGLIVAAAWSIIRLFGKQINAKMQGTWMHVVDEVSLGQNRGIVLCEVGGKIYALGVTDKEINMLFEVDNPKLMDEISQGNYELVPPNQDPWTPWVNELLQRLRLRKGPQAPMNFQNLMKEQSQKIKDIALNNNHSKESATKRSGDNE